MTNCPHCKSEVQPGWKACPACGERLPEVSSCVSCGAELQQDWKACPACGNRVDSGQGTSHRPAPTTIAQTGPTVELTVLISPVDSGKVEIGGTEIPAGVANPIKKNDTIRLTARPADDSWEFDHWEGDVLESTEQQVSLRMDTIKNVRAVFKPSRPSDRLAAAFSAAPLSGTAPLTVSFEDASTGGPKEWAWDFDNNGSNDSTESHPVFTFQEAGTYTVRLRISRDDLIDTEVKVGLITVSKR